MSPIELKCLREKIHEIPQANSGNGSMAITENGDVYAWGNNGDG